VSAKRNRHRGKHLNRTATARTDQIDNPISAVNSIADDIGTKGDPIRLGEISLIKHDTFKSTTQLNARGKLFLRAQPKYMPKSRKALNSANVWFVLSILAIPIGLVAVISTKRALFSGVANWEERTATSKLQDRALHTWSSSTATHELRGRSGEPLPIGTSMQGMGEDAVVIVRGLIPGMTLSAGSQLGGNAWRLPASDFAGAWIGPPKDFSGAVDIAAELHLPDQTIADRRRFRLEWSPPISLGSETREFTPEADAHGSSAGQAAPGLVDASINTSGQTQAVNAPPSVLVETRTELLSAPTEPSVVVQSGGFSPPDQAAQKAGVTPDTADRPVSSAISPRPQLDPEEIQVLVERGKHLLASGDLVAARVVLQRAADSKDVAAAVALGSTYDPTVLRRLKAYGVASDLETARTWYKKAKELGSEEAERRLQVLAKLGP
jgi:hypothetical protein